MELYILDSSLRRIEMVEQFESMIWTERYSAYGDFQLDIVPSLAEPALVTQGTFLGIDKSDRTMYITSVEDDVMDDGKKIFKIKGRSIEAFLEDRPNGYSYMSSPFNPMITWGPDTPGGILRWLVQNYLRTNANVATDVFPFLQAESYSATGRLEEYSSLVTVSMSPNSLYASMKELADTYNLGMRIRRPADDSKLYFDIYRGYDRTTSQTVRDAVVFSEALDSLTNTSTLTSSDSFKNVAYVFAPNGFQIVYGGAADATTTGFERKVLMVDASDITTAAGATLNTQLLQRGLQELAKHRSAIAFDGEIRANAYTYGLHYGLGDLVEKRSDAGAINQMLVSEQIFISDEQGERAYPTLTMENSINPGAWDSVSSAKFWDVYTTEVWDSM
jgi:hypothetical protein